MNFRTPACGIAGLAGLWLDFIHSPLDFVVIVRPEANWLDADCYTLKVILSAPSSHVLSLVVSLSSPFEWHNPPLLNNSYTSV